MAEKRELYCDSDYFNGKDEKIFEEAIEEYNKERNEKHEADTEIQNIKLSYIYMPQNRS